jgi:hypothetical protein
LGGFALTSLYSTGGADAKNGSFQQSLTPEQAVRYEQIAGMRRKLATHGFLLGALLSVGYALYRRFGLSKSLLSVDVACNVIAITLGATWAYYMLSPKSDYMIRYLTPGQQVDWYLEKQRGYQLRWATGLILGAAGAYVLGRGLAASK